MRVNVIVPWDQETTKGKKRGAIQRFALYLERIEDWTISGTLDPLADVNYVLGYADKWKTETDPWQKYREWCGPLAGYFTHQEPTGIKHRLWKQAAETVGLRIAESAKYADALAEYGPTEQATIPIDRDLFCLGDRAKNKIPTIGVSGYCPISGRKGNMLVYELLHYPPAQKWRIKATGRDWPVPSKIYRWQDLPGFYRRLDVYLCPSLCEGGPLGVFEALSCGTPVVIPRGVGALDELPNVPGVYRYAVGDFDGMFEVLGQCIGGKHQENQLRSLTSHMTIDAFCTDHKLIFEKHFGGVNDPHIESGTITVEAPQERQGPERIHSEVAGLGSGAAGSVQEAASVPEAVQEAPAGDDAGAV